MFDYVSVMLGIEADSKSKWSMYVAEAVCDLRINNRSIRVSKTKHKLVLPSKIDRTIKNLFIKRKACG